MIDIAQLSISRRNGENSSDWFTLANTSLHHLWTSAQSNKTSYTLGQVYKLVNVIEYFNNENKLIQHIIFTLSKYNLFGAL